MKAGIWDYDSMEERLRKHLAEYRTTTGKYRRLKRRAILIWIGWMRKVRQGVEP